MSQTCRICQKEGPEGCVARALNEGRVYCQDTDDDEELWICGSCLTARPYDVSWWCFANDHARCSYGGQHELHQCRCDCHPRPETEKPHTVRYHNSGNADIKTKDGLNFDLKTVKIEEYRRVSTKRNRHKRRRRKLRGK